MTNDDLARLESELALPVPKEYRALITNFPDELLCASDFELMNDPKRVVAMNREIRTGDFYGVAWPAQYLAIGENGCGDYYCLDTSNTGSPAPVLFFDHEKRAFEEVSKSLQEWWPTIVKGYADQ